MGMTTRTNSEPVVSTLPEGTILEDAGPGTGEHEWARNRPRLLSYIGRWGRARRWLPPDAHRVLDVGCAFGYGTVALMARGESSRWIAGVERDPENVKLAGRTYPWLPMVRADATSLPFPHCSVDAVVILDVLEHLADPVAVLVEVRRVLRPGGSLVVSVPHRGLLSACDSNNVYAALRRRCRSFLPLEPCEESATGRHRHFTVGEVRTLLGPDFAVDRFARTGVGLAELLHILLLVALKGLLRKRGAYMVLRHFYFTASLLEDLIPTGPLGYNLTLRARAIKN
jgi:SAM-dependent methyltransferase